MQPPFVTPALATRPRSVRSLLDDALRRPALRKSLSVLSMVLFLAGVALFAYPVGTDVYSNHQQGHLNSQFGGATYQTKYEKHQIPLGDALTRLVIPTLGLKVLVVEGTTPAALRAGAGHYPSTPLPGEAGNVAIAGHRTTFGRPFSHLDTMKPGDEVLLETPTTVFHYLAVKPFAGHPNPWVTNPKDVSVVQNVPGHHFLTLTTCNPKGSARQRLVLRFELDPARTEKVKPGQS